MSAQLRTVKKQLNWKNFQTLDEAKQIVDMGILLNEVDCKSTCKILSEADQIEICKYFAVRLVERIDDRLSSEIIIESVMNLMGFRSTEALVLGFLEELLSQENCEEACKGFVEISLSSELLEQARTFDILATAVATVCEMGFGIIAYENEYPGQIRKSKALLDHIATYLLSVSNENNFAVRLSLFRYFSSLEVGKSYKPYFSRIISRFGHTLFEFLFQQLFNKKTENVALQFLLDNIHCALEASDECQTIMHETFRHYMLKNPERFVLFLKVVNSEVHKDSDFYESVVSKNFFKHLTTLFKVASDLNHKDLGRDIFAELISYSPSKECMTHLTGFRNERAIRKGFREMIATSLDQMSRNDQRSAVPVSSFRAAKRGRKPTMAVRHEVGFLGQINSLADQQELQRAS